VTLDEDPVLDELLGVQGSAAVRTMLHHFPQPIGLLWAKRDGDGRIVDFDFGYGNPRILELFAFPESQRGRYTLLEALPQMRGDGSFELYVQICESGVPVVDEITFDTPFGDGYARGTLLRRTGKFADGLIVVLDDVTAQRRMEAELRGYAHAVAHDLSEPVSAMSAIVGLLERRADQPPDPRALQLLRETTTRARQLIDGVLDYARAGELQREQVSLRRLMDDVRADLGPRLQEAGAVLEVGELPDVRGDARLLRRVLQNLVANAVKFRGDEPPRVAVDGRAGAQDWIVTVRDHGIGVAPEDADRIFGMFARADPDRTGNGIGLAVCRRVVEAHGGRIWVEPGDGGGSAFRFTLPR
jgi:signal transduction histidine kinase